MWYLLVAAGAGYLAQRWQNGQKTRPLMSGCGQNQRPSPPSSAPATPKMNSPLFLSKDLGDSDIVHNVNTSFSDLTDKDGGSIDSEGISGCVISGIAESNPQQQLGTKLLIDSSQDGPSSLQVKSNKRSACEAFLVPVSDAVKPSQGNTKEEFVSNSRPSLDFASIDSQERLQEDSSSPSSCCSSNSTVINSPVGSQPIPHKFGSVQFQGNKQKQEINVCEQLSTLRNNVAGSYFESSSDFVECDASKGRGKGAGFTMSHYHHTYPEVFQHASPAGCEGGLLNSMIVLPGLNATSSNGSVAVVLPGLNATSSNVSVAVTNDNMMLDASTYRPHVFTGGNHVFTGDNHRGHTRPYVFTGDNQRGNSSPSFFSNDSMGTEKSKPQVKQGTPEMATDPKRKARPLLSSSHSITTETISDAESESLVSFGLAMAVFFMVSSGKREMEKMGKVLKETEDLVSDMRKELEERRARSSVSSLSYGECGNEEFFTIKTKDADAAQVYTTEKAQNDTDGCCKDDLSDDESIRSMVSEEQLQDRLQMCDLEAELQFVDANLEGSDIRTKQVHCSNSGKASEGSDLEDEKDSLTLEEADYVVSMIELERRLWKVCQERQEEKILELEEALEVALSNLHAKEEELRWWKSRASWLMEHSFGSTSGRAGLREVSIEAGVNRGGVNHTLNSMKECDAGEKIKNRSSANQTSLLAVEGCIEIVENEGCLTNTQNQMVRICSACSISSEDSVLSFDVRTVTDSEYKGFIQPS